MKQNKYTNYITINSKNKLYWTCSNFDKKTENLPYRFVRVIASENIMMGLPINFGILISTKLTDIWHNPFSFKKIMILLE